MRDVLVCAFKSLSRKWSRTLLTVSGITVGVAMVGDHFDDRLPGTRRG